MNTTITNSTVSANDATLFGGGIYVEAGALLLAVDLTVTNNTARADAATYVTAGGGIYNRGTAILHGGRVHGNHAPNAPGANLCNQANLTYALPAPPGFYEDGIFLCGQELCFENDHYPGHVVVCPEQSCDATLLNGTNVSNIREGAIDEELPTPCPRGFYGTSVGADHQRTALCSGICPPGKVCAELATVEPKPSPAGYYAPPGSQEPLRCGGPSVFCPGGGEVPLQVGAGNESFTDENLAPSWLSLKDSTTRTSQRKCSLAWCSGGLPFNCSLGSYANWSQPSELRTNEQAACSVCPFDSTTAVAGGTSAAACLCAVGFYDDLRQLDEEGRRCAPLPIDGSFAGTTGVGVNTSTLVVAAGYWRPSASATRAGRCPINGTCAGGPTPPTFSIDDASGCHDGFRGPLCTACVSASRYLSATDGSAQCRDCADSVWLFGGIIVTCIGVAAAVLIAAMLRAHLRARCAASHASSTRSSLRESLQQQPLPDVAPPVHADGDAVPALLPLAPPRHTRLRGAWRGCKTAVVAGGMELKAVCGHVANLPAVLWLRASAESCAFFTKLKICLGVTLIVAQMGAVYQLRYPPSYHAVHSHVFAALRGKIPGLHLECFGMGRLVNQLQLYTLLPAALVALGFAVTWCRHRSLLPALPNTLRFTYLVFPIVSSKGFQAFASCDCYENVDGDDLCLLPSDWHVVCPKDAELIAVALVAVVLYGLGIPTAYALLLWRCREAIGTGEPTELSRALHFLHKELWPAALWWPLAEALRALLLTGFLAAAPGALKPGSITQLLCGLVVAVGFLVLQLWCAPYRRPGNNFVAMVGGAGLVLQFISSLGVQINAATGVAYVDNSLVTAGLFVSAFAVFIITVRMLPCALPQRSTHF